MLFRMLYTSAAVGPVTTAVTGTILRVAQAHNAAHGITGVLCQGRGRYLQVLEGERSALDALYARIAADQRHKDLVLVCAQTITSRRYGRWAMAHVDLADADERMAFSATSSAPAGSSEQLMAQIDALITAGKVMTEPVV